MKLLLVVEDAFEIAGRGVLVMPGIPAAEFEGATTREVDLRSRDGQVLRRQASFSIPRDKNMDPGNPYFLCLLHGASRSDVPAGTEIWSAEPP